VPAKDDAPPADAAAAKLRVASAITAYEALDLCRAFDLKLIGVAPRRETLEELFVRIVGAAQATRRP